MVPSPRAKITVGAFRFLDKVVGLLEAASAEVGCVNESTGVSR